MSENPAPPVEAAAESVYRPTWHDVFLHCLAERDRFEILRAYAASEGGTARAARHARTIAIYETLMRLVENCEGSATITAELRRIAAERAPAIEGDEEAG